MIETSTKKIWKILEQVFDQEHKESLSPKEEALSLQIEEKYLDR